MLSRHVILKLLPVLLDYECLFTEGLVAYVIENLVESLIVLLREVRSHLLLMYHGSSSTNCFIRA